MFWYIPTDRENDLLISGDLFGKVSGGIALVIPARKILEVLNHPIDRSKGEKNTHQNKSIDNKIINVAHE